MALPAAASEFRETRVDPQLRRMLNGLCDPQARALVYVLLDRADGDRVFVWRALTDSLPPEEEDDERRQLAALALRSCQRERGSAAKRTYSDWVALQPRPHAFPSAWQITTWFDGWAHALAGAEIEPSGDFRSRRQLSRKRYTEEELDDALAAFVGDQPDGVLLGLEYVRWIAQELEAERPRVRGPRSLEGFARIGGWAGALERHGLGHRAYLEVCRHRRRWPADRYTDEDLIGWLHRAAAELGPNPSSARWDPWAFEQRRVAEARGETLFVPALQSITARFGSWVKAKQIAGLGGRVASRSHTPRFREEELREAVERAMRRYGPTLTKAEYTQWRDSRLAELRATHLDARVPSVHTLNRVYTSLRAACDRVLSEHPELLHRSSP